MRALPGREARAQLPAHPAGVTRVNAPADQRRRILRAIAELVVEHGYAAVTIELIVKRAHVAYETLYRHFSGKREGFVALFDASVRQTESILRARLLAERRPWPGRVELSLRILIERIAAEPVIARAVIVEAPAAGPDLRERHRRLTGALAPLLRGGRDHHRHAAEPPDTLEETLSGAVFWIAQEHLCRGEADLLPGLLPELVELVLSCYAGRALATTPLELHDQAAAAPHRHPGRATEDQNAFARANHSDAAHRSLSATATAQAGSIPPPESRPQPAVSERFEESWVGELGPLPGGSHGLSRGQIMESQRERLLAAVSHLVATRGYHSTTITDIANLASVSTPDFYAHFAAKEDCFLAALDAVCEYLASHLAGVACAEPDWPRALIAALRAVLEFFAAEPDLARLCLVAPLSATPAGAESFREAVHACVSALATGRQRVPVAEALPPSTEDFLIGGAVSLATHWVHAGQTERLPILLEDIVDFVLGPYLGSECAAELAAEAALA